MAYTFTERKRIRKSFGTRESVLKIPYLLQMQKDAYTAFLQADTPPKKRTHEGLQAAFESAFPIISHNGFVEMKFIEYNLAKPTFDVRECQTLPQCARACSSLFTTASPRPPRTR